MDRGPDFRSRMRDRPPPPLGQGPADRL